MAQPPAFEAVADDYHLARPRYPDAVFDLLGDLDGRVVLEGGAGTGIATTALVERGARVVAFDLGPVMLRGAAAVANAGAAVGDGARLPVVDGCADLLCYAQAWHWVAQPAGSTEAARVLRPGGRWAAWWNQPRADGRPWFDRVWDLVEAACPGVERSQRDTDWGASLQDERFERPEHTVVRWTRQLTPATWRRELTTHSAVAALDDGPRARLVADVDAVLDPLGDTVLDVPYETAVWVAQRVRDVDANR